MISDAHVNVNEAWYTQRDENSLLHLGVCCPNNCNCILSQAPTVEIDQSAPSTTVDVKATETPPSSNITEHNTVSSLNNSNTNGDN